MLTPFQAHTSFVGMYENFIGGGNPLATLTFTTLAGNPSVPVTHTKIDGGYIMSNGKSPTTTIERCEFRSSLISMALWQYIIKGLFCTLVMAPGTPPIFLQLWEGGLVEGTGNFRFMLTDQNFKA